jgi:acyl-CoA synthetase (AMP-forming)/AMP-acid ligase II
MATYLELRELFKDSDLQDKVEVAAVIAASDMLENTPSAAQKIWAAAVFDNPRAEAKKLLMAVLADKKNASVSEINALTDNNIKNRVALVAPFLVDAMVGG